MNLEKGLNCLSLFDGMSCGQIALERVGIKVDNYFASEIDKYAIKVTQSNYPNTKQLGCVTEIKGSDLPKIDLFIGGSPCQGFSFAGKQLNFEDERSKLFFEYVRLLKEVKPKYFLLENVKMKKEYQDIISSYLGIEPIEINSALVSAQSRKRLYWTNIPNVTYPKDLGIILNDILEENIVDYFNKHRVEKFEKTLKDNPIASKNGIIQLNNPSYSQQRVYHPDGKSPTISAGNLGGGKEPCKIKIDNPIRTSIINKGSQGDRVYSIKAKGICLNAQSGGTAGNGNMLIEELSSYRKLTPIECERLQTVPDNYTNYVSNSQRYKMLGNGWTVDVIAHIFKGLK